MREIDLQIDDFMVECSANDVKQLHLKIYIRYLQEREKYTVSFQKS